MAQYEVFRLQSGLMVVDLQTDLIGMDASRIVAPLREAGTYAVFAGLTPMVRIGGEFWIVRVQELAAVPAKEPKNCVGALREERDHLKRALDILIDGFWRSRACALQDLIID